MSDMWKSNSRRLVDRITGREDCGNERADSRTEQPAPMTRRQFVLYLLGAIFLVPKRRQTTVEERGISRKRAMFARPTGTV